jgi:hypothetical protein
MSGKSPLRPPVVVDYRPYTKGFAAVRRHEDCAGNWNQYYRNNAVNGYKDRHYILREFTELAAALGVDVPPTVMEGDATGAGAAAGGDAAKAEPSKRRRSPPPREATAAATVTLMEVGCGVGNAVLPLLAEHPQLLVSAFDISSVAVGLLREQCAAARVDDRCRGLVHDVSVAPLPRDTFLHRGHVDCVTFIFVLCSIPLQRQEAAVRHIAECLRPPTSDGAADGGVLFFRDYADGDLAQTRFENGARHVADDAVAAAAVAGDAGPRLREHSTYARSNGTLSHFFTSAEVVALFGRCGLAVVDIDVVARAVVNRKSEAVMDRRWVQGRFRRTR